MGLPSGGIPLLDSRQQNRRHRRAAAGAPVHASVFDHARHEADLVLALVEVGCFLGNRDALLLPQRHEGTKISGYREAATKQSRGRIQRRGRVRMGALQIGKGQTL